MLGALRRPVPLATAAGLAAALALALACGRGAKTPDITSPPGPPESTPPPPVTPPPPPPPVTSRAPARVTEHHGGPRRDGLYIDGAFTRSAVGGLFLDPSFAAPLDGPIVAQLLFVAGVDGRDLVIAASANNEVVAFDADGGGRVWARVLADALPRSAIPCSNLDPVGVTGTPIADVASGTLYVAALTSPDGGMTKRHLVFALSLADGSDRSGWPVAIGELLRARGLPFDDEFENQRGALALAGGFLYLPFGGHNQECGDFRGVVAAVPVADPAAATAYMTGSVGGGIWAPSGVAVADGRVYAATGNTYGASTWTGGEAVLQFPAGAPLGPAPADAFIPADWQDLDLEDLDVGSSGTVIVDVPGATPSALIVAMGKDGKIYLLDRASLGGLGGALAVEKVVRGPIIDAAAAYTTTRGTYVVFRSLGGAVGCPDGGRGSLVAIRISPTAPPQPSVAWCAEEVGLNAPIVTTSDGQSDAVVWSVAAGGDGRLHAYDGDTGEIVYSPHDGLGGVRKFHAPIVAGGRLFVGTDVGVKAFRVP
ncbi:MAG TPA: hypothetical protein VFP65_14425 [Anaeromyxobacteraceae bacterium]|nr:hypothetical protein [Anaeromyxobacteraceae bacterium]